MKKWILTALGFAFGLASTHADAQFSGCTEDESAMVQSAIDRSVELLEASHSEFAWVRFFGDEEPIRESAQVILTQLRDSLLLLGAAAEEVTDMEVGNLEYGCTTMNCPGRVAWVAPGKNHVNICPGFFELNEAEHWSDANETRVSTLVHEAFHYVTGIQTHYAEDARAAITLAQEDPYYALQNADSYGFLIQDEL